MNNLLSYRDIKNKVINSKTGLLASTGFGISATLAYALEDLKMKDKYDFLINLS